MIAFSLMVLRSYGTHDIYVGLEDSCEKHMPQNIGGWISSMESVILQQTVGRRTATMTFDIDTGKGDS